MKKKTKYFLAPLLLVSLLIIPFKAQADGLVYTGAHLGYADLGSSDSTAFGVHLGTGLLPFVGLEAGYWNFGEMGNADYSSYYFAAKPTLKLGSFQLFVKGGIARYDKDASFGKSDDGVDLMYGLGVDYFITRMFSVGGNYNNFGFDGDDIDTLTFSVTLHFP